jgi:hypothetical protein
MRKFLTTIAIIAGMPVLMTAQSEDPSTTYGYIDFKTLNTTAKTVDLRVVNNNGRTLEKLPTWSDNEAVREVETNKYYRISELPIGDDEVLLMQVGETEKPKIIQTEPFDFEVNEGETVHFLICPRKQARTLLMPKI